ncbi:ferrochelatase [Magnetococcales bacterium HHB-1]
MIGKKLPWNHTRIQPTLTTRTAKKMSSHANLSTSSPLKIGILVVQLGTPDAPTIPAIRRYLKEFLSDHRVVDLPAWRWKPILHGIILPRRPKRSAELYQKIWRKDGLSPLLYYSQQQTKAIQQAHPQHFVELGMRYGHPSIPEALMKLHAKKIDHLLIFPLFPQYSGATTATILDAVQQFYHQRRFLPEIHMVNQFHIHPAFIQAQANHYQQQAEKQTAPSYWLFSYHGLPQRHIDEGDPYATQCHSSAQQLADAMNLSKGEWEMTFQSRFGKEPWLLPATEDRFKQLPKEGKKRLTVICPGFVSDCLETLEEINIGGRETFLKAGGEQFTYLPCLNNQSLWFDGLNQMITQRITHAFS